MNTKPPRDLYIIEIMANGSYRLSNALVPADDCEKWNVLRTKTIPYMENYFSFQTEEEYENSRMNALVDDVIDYITFNPTINNK